MAPALLRLVATDEVRKMQHVIFAVVMVVVTVSSVFASDSEVEFQSYAAQPFVESTNVEIYASQALVWAGGALDAVQEVASAVQNRNLLQVSGLEAGADDSMSARMVEVAEEWGLDRVRVEVVRANNEVVGLMVNYSVAFDF
jgi:hypothetical protein